MNHISQKMGYWASWLSFTSFAIYTLCFIAILFVNPLFIWHDFPNYIRTVQTTNQLFKHIAMIFMIVHGACFVIQLTSIEEQTVADRRVFIKAGKLFGLGFFTLIAANYFVQLSAVRLQIASGHVQGLEQWVQANPVSAMAALNMLGWTVFYGLSCFFSGLAFGGDHLDKVIRYAFLANGVMMLVGAVCYVFNWTIPIFILMNLGLGVAVATVDIALIIWFGRQTATKGEFLHG